MRLKSALDLDPRDVGMILVFALCVGLLSIAAPAAIETLVNTVAFGVLLWPVIALALVMLTLPVWWVPPLVAVLPPLLWGWLTMRLMSYDVLAQHASADERDQLLEKFRWPLLCMGIASGMLGAVPTFFWATSALALVLFPLVSFVALWIYSLIFVFAALWFSHFLLDALKELRQEELDKALTVQARVVEAELPY